MRYHGNYCGPNWSAGKYQASVIDATVPAIDEFDDTCLLHDAVYAIRGDTTAADIQFARSNFLKGPQRTLASLAVGSQGLVKCLLGAQINMPKNLRSSPAPKKAQNQPVKTKNVGSNTKLSTVPASYGFSLKMKPPVVKHTGNKAAIIGSDFAGSVLSVNTPNYQPAASVILNPAYFQNAMLGSLARAYEKFRFTKAVVQFIPSVPTSTQGQLVMCSSRSVKEPFFNGSSSTFLSRALSQGNAVATPLWMESTLDVPCQGEWSIVDTLLDGDLDDSVQEEIQCYAFCDTTQSCGILMLHYEIEFKDPLYTYHPTMIPVPMGNGSFGTLADNSAINAVGDAVRLVPSTGFTFTGGNGSVYRLVFRQEASVLPTGPGSWATLAAVESTAANTSGLVSTNSSPVSMSTGSVFYAVITVNDIVLYASYEGAANGSLNDTLLYNAATTAIGSWAFIGVLVRLGSAFRITNQ